MHIRIFLTLLLLLCSMRAATQPRKDIPELQRPRLVVGLVIDQMRWDYLTRFADRYGDGGFRRLMREGYNANRTLINYLPSITAVGHSAIYTGSVPALNGIVGNSFYENGQYVYCTDDSTVTSLGTTDANNRPTPRDGAGLQSPHQLLSTTIGDELRMATNFRSRVIGISIKDRASILPAGHSANAAYWLDSRTNRFITSSHYMSRLPQWVERFNAQNLGEKYMKNLTPGQKPQAPWPLLYDAKTYIQSAPIGQSWEATLRHDLRYSPWGMTITFDMARAAIAGEGLGRNPSGDTDLLALSISSPDMIGHELAPNSIWMEALYLRLDQEIAAFLTYLDETVGKDQYTLFLSADHASMHNSAWSREHRMPGVDVHTGIITQTLNQLLRQRFPDLKANPVRGISNLQVVFADEALRSPHYADILSAACTWLGQQPEIAYAFPLAQIPTYLPEPVRTMVINGYSPQRGGHIQLIYRAGAMEDSASEADFRKPGHIRTGTTHSLWSPDDTHIPLIFFGFGVDHAWDNTTRHITDIAPTICALLNIQQPSACVGEAIPLRR
jgi:predicted AlkP superfamily pyrophosphatase or phosphodiesterase